jgi:hypothetical protein
MFILGDVADRPAYQILKCVFSFHRTMAHSIFDSGNRHPTPTLVDATGTTSGNARTRGSGTPIEPGKGSRDPDWRQGADPKSSPRLDTSRESSPRGRHKRPEPAATPRTQGNNPSPGKAPTSAQVHRTAKSDSIKYSNQHELSISKSKGEGKVQGRNWQDAEQACCPIVRSVAKTKPVHAHSRGAQTATVEFDYPLDRAHTYLSLFLCECCGLLGYAG